MKTHKARLLAMASLTLAAFAFPARAAKPTDPFKSNADVYPLTSETTKEQGQQPAPAQYPWAQSSNEYVQDWPATEIRAIPGARAGAVKAKWEYYRAKDNLYSTVDLLKEDFEDSQKAQSAKTVADTAHDQLDAARQRVLGRLSQDPRYQALRKLRDQADQQVQRLREQHSTPQQVAAAAQVKMEYARQLSEMEHDALVSDPNYDEAKARLVVASQDVTRIRSAFQRALVRGDDFREARRDWEDARIDYVVAATYRDSVIDVANAAINYAYDLHYYDVYKYLHMGSYGYYPYCNNYGTGYYGVGYNYGTPVVNGHSSMFRY